MIASTTPTANDAGEHAEQQPRPNLRLPGPARGASGAPQRQRVPSIGTRKQKNSTQLVGVREQRGAVLEKEQDTDADGDRDEAGEPVADRRRGRWERSAARG